MISESRSNLSIREHSQCYWATVENIAGMISDMDPKELETLCALIGEQEKESIDRRNDIESGKV